MVSLHFSIYKKWVGASIRGGIFSVFFIAIHIHIKFCWCYFEADFYITYFLRAYNFKQSVQTFNFKSLKC